MLLSERRLGPKLYGVFAGGRLEEYIPSRCMEFSEFKSPPFSTAIARKLANIHGIDVPISKHPTWLFNTLQNWSQLIVNYKTDPNDSQLLQDSELERQLCAFDYTYEINWLRQLLTTSGSPVVF
ncbi:unnamed protein product, partial [Oppiella nova]